jgi:ribosomal protein L27
VRYAHGDELTDLPGVTGIGMGKDHIILYVADDNVEVPEKIEDVKIVKIRR